jgi:glycosyltransferase involved in cell wall biosynthesis
LSETWTIPQPMSMQGRVDELRGKKIVILIGSFIRGGCQRQAYLLVRDLRERHGLDAEVWALCWDGDYAKEFEAAGVPIRVLNFRRPMPHCDTCGVVSPRSVRSLRWAKRLWDTAWEFRKAKVDILLPYTTWPNVIAGLTYRLGGVRVCIWGERHAGGERVPGAERMAVRQYRRFVANSSAGAEFLAQEMRVPRERITFVPNGVEDPKFDKSTDWRARLGLEPSQPLVVKVANISEFKDHPTLLRAWKMVQDAWTGGDKPFLALAGSFDHRYHECRRLVRELGLETSMEFLGSVPDVAALLQACDLTVFSSPNEGMPNGVLESMAAGKSVIASDLPGIRDALGPGAGEALVPPGDADMFARKILELLRDKTKRDAWGSANRRRIEKEFSVQRMADRHLQVIQASLAKRDAGAPALVGAATQA